WPDRALGRRQADEPRDLRGLYRDPARPGARTGRHRHSRQKAAAILKERGAWFLFLPPDSPDLNPIEMAYAKLKAHLRRIGARTIDALWKAVGDICRFYPPDECRNYLQTAGYAPK